MYVCRYICINDGKLSFWCLIRPNRLKIESAPARPNPTPVHPTPLWAYLLWSAVETICWGCLLRLSVGINCKDYPLRLSVKILNKTYSVISRFHKKLVTIHCKCLKSQFIPNYLEILVGLPLQGDVVTGRCHGLAVAAAAPSLGHGLAWRRRHQDMATPSS